MWVSIERSAPEQYVPVVELIGLLLLLLWSADGQEAFTAHACRRFVVGAVKLLKVIHHIVLVQYRAGHDRHIVLHIAVAVAFFASYV